VPGTADIVSGSATDPATLTSLEGALRAAGVRHIETMPSAPPHPSGLMVEAGTPAENPGTVTALAAMGVPGPGALPAQGYVLAMNQSSDGIRRIVLSGADDVGTFYAAQSLRQVMAESARGRWVTGLVVRDWPAFATRGGMQSFYGSPWSAADNADQLQFLAASKMNTYFYGVAGDAHTDKNWDLLYSPAELAVLRRVVDQARRLHITFIYRISPEDPLDASHGICHSSAADRQKLIARLQQMWDVGVRSFTIAWDDVAGQFTCAADQQAYGADLSPIAAAQTSVVNFVQQQFIGTHPGALPLATVPTEYSGDQSDTYRSRFDSLLDPAVQIFWTGPGVISTTITTSDISATQRAFPRHRLLIWDNYPVNDGAPSRLFLGPLQGRSPGLYRYSPAIMFNELQEQAPSHIPLFTEADYAWNPAAYDAASSWDRALHAVGGPACRPLRTLAENDQSSFINGTESPTLARDIATYRAAYASGTGLGTAATSLAGDFAQLASVPAGLRAGLPDRLFLSEASGWIIKAGDYGSAGQAAVAMLSAQLRSDPATAWAQRVRLENLRSALAAIPQVVAAGVIDPFLQFAASESDGYLGAAWYRGTGQVSGQPGPASGSALAAAADGEVTTAYRAAQPPQRGQALMVPLTKPRRLGDVEVLQDPGAPAAGQVEAHVSGGGWVRLGPLTGGYTDAPAGGQMADSIRIAWAGRGPAPAVYEIVPRYAGQLPGALTTSGHVLADPGATRTVTVTLQADTAGDVQGSLTARGPAGWTVTPPVQDFQLQSGNRLISRTFTETIKVPASAAGGTYQLSLVAAAGGRQATATAPAEVATAAFDPYAAAVLRDQPSGYWRLGDPTGPTAADWSGNALDGIYSGSVLLGQPPAIKGTSDTSALFTGGYVGVPSSSAIDVTGPFTLEAWVKPATTTTDPGEGIIEKYDTPAQNGYILRLAGGNKLQGWVLGSSSYSYVSGHTSLAAGQWSYVAAVYDGQNLTVYVNGVPDGSVAATIRPGPGSGSMKIGARGDDANQRFTGGIDEVALYGHSLTPGQIAAHYAAGS
jgi:hyaluronoglucosaminidase